MNSAKPPKPAVDDEFLSVLRDVGSVSVAARQLGLNVCEAP